MSKLATVQLTPDDHGRFSLAIQCLSAPEKAAALAREQRVGRLRPGGPSLRPAGPLAPPSPSRGRGGGHEAGSSRGGKLGKYEYTKQQLIEHGKRCVRLVLRCAQN